MEGCLGGGGEGGNTSNFLLQIPIFWVLLVVCLKSELFILWIIFQLKVKGRGGGGGGGGGGG